MTRTLRTKRLYFLGDYRNIEFEDTIELPDLFIDSHDVVGRIRNLQILTIEKAFREYQRLQATKVNPLAKDFDQVIAMLTEEQEQVREELLDIFNNGKEDKEQSTEMEV